MQSITDIKSRSDDFVSAIGRRLRTGFTGIERFLATRLQKTEGADSLPPRPHQYGLAYLLACQTLSGDPRKRRTEKALQKTIEKGQPKGVRDQPKGVRDDVAWEFLWHPTLLGHAEHAQPLPDWPLRFRNNDVANWRLLRLLDNVLHPGAAWRGAKKRRAVSAELDRIGRRYRWTEDGFLCDEPNTRSFCYHCFSASLLGELNSYLPGVCEDLWRRASRWCVDLTLPDGRAMLLGRGQHQIFGYAALILTLARRAVDDLASGGPRDQDYESLHALDRVTAHVESFFRYDGSLPIVLRQGPEGSAEQFTSAGLTEPQYAGWYAYNTPWDYLPFAAWHFRRAERMLRSLSSREIQTPAASTNSPAVRPRSILGPGFRLQHNRGGAILFAAPTRGYWADGQPFPWTSDWDTPLVGADQIAGDFSIEDLPLPGGELAPWPQPGALREQLAWVSRKLASRLRGAMMLKTVNLERSPQRYFAFWDKLAFHLKDDGVVGVGPSVRFSRRWSIFPDEIIVHDRIDWRRRMNFLRFSPLQLLLYQAQPAQRPSPEGSGHLGRQRTGPETFGETVLWEFAGPQGDTRLCCVEGAAQHALGRWTRRSVLTPQGPADLLCEQLDQYCVQPGDALERRIILKASLNATTSLHHDQRLCW